MTTFDLPAGPRLLLQVELTPVQGTRFQPTGFPDVGAGVYTLPNGDEQLLLESAQSVANRLEAACWDEARNELYTPLEGLPYVRVNAADGSLLTTSIQEAHRLNSVYIEKSDFANQLVEAIAFDEKKPLDRHKLITALARFDIGCLLHGVFLESIAGVLRVPRAISGFIEADRVGRVTTGGVKNDRVQPGKDEESGRTATEGFGNVPFHRTEFVAERITAYFNLDLEQLRGYRLGDAMQRLLLALGLFKVRKFLETGLRLRTACDLAAGALEVKAPTGFVVPELAAIEAALPELIKAASEHFASPPVSIATFTSGEKKATRGKR
ncbi:MAG: type I-U CRISPR-associated protein Cas7 [Deltaproteobacteria bacterium]|nr:type I-U CRISPR-associated protein Cas7 [Deltaproteobacteria bacterium]MBK8238944.1 type I-U CRISPR-associated protein Cas7 [Deltaproteobacteria bacterium]MBK8717461.1 type I-U CRISPR-associated protein Cas7 [Deltaproteobacteria bacterium]MBP7291753.1 type I-U CRISPR-associated protein Cas7 [Nannocystaceae bacterium]